MLLAHGFSGGVTAFQCAVHVLVPPLRFVTTFEMLTRMIAVVASRGCSGRGAPSNRRARAARPGDRSGSGECCMPKQNKDQVVVPIPSSDISRTRHSEVERSGSTARARRKTSYITRARSRTWTYTPKGRHVVDDRAVQLGLGGTRGRRPLPHSLLGLLSGGLGSSPGLCAHSPRRVEAAHNEQPPGRVHARTQARHGGNEGETVATRDACSPVCYEVALLTEACSFRAWSM